MLILFLFMKSHFFFNFTLCQTFLSLSFPHPFTIAVFVWPFHSVNDLSPSKTSPFSSLASCLFPTFPRVSLCILCLFLSLSIFCLIHGVSISLSLSLCLLLSVSLSLS